MEGLRRLGPDGMWINSQSSHKLHVYTLQHNQSKISIQLTVASSTSEQGSTKLVITLFAMTKATRVIELPTDLPSSLMDVETEMFHVILPSVAEP